MRHKIIVLLCRLFRHPTEYVVYANGSAKEACPCGHIDVRTRAFHKENGL